MVFGDAESISGVEKKYNQYKSALKPSWPPILSKKLCTHNSLSTDLQFIVLP